MPIDRTHPSSQPNTCRRNLLLLWETDTDYKFDPTTFSESSDQFPWTSPDMLLEEREQKDIFSGELGRFSQLEYFQTQKSLLGQGQDKPGWSWRQTCEIKPKGKSTSLLRICVGTEGRGSEAACTEKGNSRWAKWKARKNGKWSRKQNTIKAHKFFIFWPAGLG